MIRVSCFDKVETPAAPECSDGAQVDVLAEEVLFGDADYADLRLDLGPVRRPGLSPLRSDQGRILTRGLVFVVEAEASALRVSWLHPYHSLRQKDAWLSAAHELEATSRLRIGPYGLSLCPPRLPDGLSFGEALCATAIPGQLGSEDEERLLTLSAEGDDEASAALYLLAQRRASLGLAFEAALRARPEPASWHALSFCLERWPEARTLPLAVERVRQRSAGWPPALREAAPAWWRAVQADRPAPFWPLVDSLRLWRCDAQAWTTLCSSPRMSGLKALRLCGLHLQPAMLRELARSHALSALEALELVEINIDLRGMLALLSGELLGRLKSLVLRRCRLDDGCVAHLARSELVKALVGLDLGQNVIGDAGATSLARSPQFAGLELLELGGNSIGTVGLRALRSSVRLGEGVLRLSATRAN